MTADALAELARDVLADVHADDLGDPDEWQIPQSVAIAAMLRFAAKLDEARK